MFICFNSVNNKLGLYRIRNLNTWHNLKSALHITVNFKDGNTREMHKIIFCLSNCQINYGNSCPPPPPYFFFQIEYFLYYPSRFTINDLPIWYTERTKNGNIKEIHTTYFWYVSNWQIVYGKSCPPPAPQAVFLFSNRVFSLYYPTKKKIYTAPTNSSKWNIKYGENTIHIPAVVPPPLHLQLHDQ